MHRCLYRYKEIEGDHMSDHHTKCVKEFHGIKRPRTTLHYTTLHYTTLHYTTLHLTELN
ncbi:MAG: hypothetical protein ACJATI_002853 [Halioglobus sp.]|jgi:hypothetical protein